MNAITNGTAKQNQFAADLRAKFIKGLENAAADCRKRAERVQSPAMFLASAAQNDALAAAARTIDDARFWLDHGRDDERCIALLAERAGIEIMETL